MGFRWLEEFKPTLTACWPAKTVEDTRPQQRSIPRQSALIKLPPALRMMIYTAVLRPFQKHIDMIFLPFREYVIRLPPLVRVDPLMANETAQAFWSTLPIRLVLQLHDQEGIRTFIRTLGPRDMGFLLRNPNVAVHILVPTSHKNVCDCCITPFLLRHYFIGAGPEGAATRDWVFTFETFSKTRISRWMDALLGHSRILNLIGPWLRSRCRQRVDWDERVHDMLDELVWGAEVAFVELQGAVGKTSDEFQPRWWKVGVITRPGMVLSDFNF